MIILITGGASGLGKSITEKMAQQNDTLIYFTYHNSSKSAEDIESRYKNTKSIHCNFSDKDSVMELVKKIGEINLDVIVNNAFAGKIEKQYFHKTNLSVFTSSFKNNIEPFIVLNKEVISVFRKKKAGKIITILTSYLINRPPIGLSEYVAQKAYMHSLTKSWSTENAQFNITSNCISPSIMLTNLTSDTDERIIEEMISKHPLKKLLEKDEVANIVVFLSQATNHMNGANIIVNAASDVV
jgi:3-oxoacyl-[acyl-carrier protein] reductase